MPGTLSKDNVFSAACLAFAVFEVWAIVNSALDPWIHRAMFLGFSLMLLFVGNKRGGRVRGTVNILLAVLTVVATIYLVTNGERFVTRWPMVSPLSSFDLLVGLLMVLLTLWFTWEDFGWVLISIVTIFIIYSFVGNHLPGALYHQGMTFKTFIDQNVYTVSGLLGIPVGVAATYIFAFVTFGSFLEIGGGGDFFYKLAGAIAGRAVGGPAKVGIISSGLYGMISGSAVSDAATTGSFTIPMMKRLGFSPTFAAAVEAVAATGGGIMPPVMGSVAFLMAELTGIPYVKIALASFMPALLYYAGLYWQIHYHSLRLGFRPMNREEIEPLGVILKSNFQYLIPLIALVWLLISGMLPAVTALIASVLALAASWVKKETRMGIRKIIKAIETTCRRVIGITAVCAAAGLVIGGVTFSGLSGKVLSLIMMVSSGNLLIALLVTAVVTIILGMGIPVVPAYAITSVLVAPALQELGLSTLVAHLFVMYFATMSAITPPVAVAAYVTAGIAEADPTKTGFSAMRLGFITFIVPFMFAFQPALALQGTWMQLLVAIPTAALGTWALAISFEGWFCSTISIWRRFPLAVAGLLLLYPLMATSLLGLVVLIPVLLFQYRMRSNPSKGSHLRA